MCLIETYSKHCGNGKKWQNISCKFRNKVKVPTITTFNQECASDLAGMVGKRKEDVIA